MRVYRRRGAPGLLLHLPAEVRSLIGPYECDSLSFQLEACGGRLAKADDLVEGT
jgi:hypothetical protein